MSDSDLGVAEAVFEGKSTFMPTHRMRYDLVTAISIIAVILLSAVVRERSPYLLQLRQHPGTAVSG